MEQNQTMRTCDTLLLSAADGQQALQKAGQQKIKVVKDERTVRD